MQSTSALPKRNVWRTLVALVRDEEARSGYLFVMPSFAFFLIFTLVPVLASFYLAFFRWNPLDPFEAAKFIGIENFTELITKPDFIRTMWNTFVFVVASVAIMICGALGTALALNQGIRAESLLRGLYYSPVVTSLVATAVIWLWIFDPQFGIINALLEVVGLPDDLRWASDPVLAMPTVIITFVWREVGYFTVIYLAGLQGIPSELKEAARIDGANAITTFRYVVIPLLMPTTLFVLVLGILRATQNSFAVIYIMTGGGPVNATNVMVFYMYQNAFEFFRMGFASAVSLFIFILIFSLSLLQFRLIGARTEYL